MTVSDILGFAKFAVPICTAEAPAIMNSSTCSKEATQTTTTNR